MRGYLAVLFAVAIGASAGCVSTEPVSSEQPQAVDLERSAEELHQEAAVAAGRQLYSLFKRQMAELVRLPIEASNYPSDVKARLTELAYRELAEERFVEVLAPRYVERFSTTQLDLFREFVWVTEGKSLDQLTDYEQQGVRRMHDKFLAAGVSREQFVEFADLFSIYFEKVARQAAKAIDDEERRYLAQQNLSL